MAETLPDQILDRAILNVKKLSSEVVKRSIDFLLGRKANPNVKGYSYGPTPLIKAIKQQNSELIDCLLTAGADVDCAGYYSTPLIAAIETGDLALVRRLRALGADVNKHGWDPEDTPLHKAEEGDHAEIKAFLIAEGAEMGVGEVSPVSIVAKMGHC
jgi:ankyrin repeat protein